MSQENTTMTAGAVQDMRAQLAHHQRFAAKHREAMTQHLSAALKLERQIAAAVGAARTVVGEPAA